MPYDGPMPAGLKPDLKTLSIVLRDRTLWPAGFTWDYSNCQHCAMGLADRLFSIIKGGITVDMTHDNIDACSEALNLPFNIGAAIFLRVGVGDETTRTMSEVTPEQVADEIDAYLKITAHRDYLAKHLAKQ